MKAPNCPACPPPSVVIRAPGEACPPEAPLWDYSAQGVKQADGSVVFSKLAGAALYANLHDQWEWMRDVITYCGKVHAPPASQPASQPVRP